MIVRSGNFIWTRDLNHHQSNILLTDKGIIHGLPYHTEGGGLSQLGSVFCEYISCFIGFSGPADLRLNWELTKTNPTSLVYSNYTSQLINKGNKMWALQVKQKIHTGYYEILVRRTELGCKSAEDWEIHAGVEKSIFPFPDFLSFVKDTCFRSKNSNIRQRQPN